MVSNAAGYVDVDWPAPAHVRARQTTRVGGVSIGAYESLNLATHVGDETAAVAQNRARLRAALELPTEPLWLNQVHGADVVDAARVDTGVSADGAYTNQAAVVCAVLTADCLPIFLCDRTGTEVAVLHAGWRGLAAGVIEAGVARFRALPADLLAWLGPAIGQQAFEVGDEVRAAFLAHDAAAARAFVGNERGRWWADIYALARLRLQALGVSAVHGGGYCTITQADRFYSYRRDGATGRMASLIWLERQKPD